MAGICEICGKEKPIDVHHKDGNHNNDVLGNRQSLCGSCHRRRHIEMRLEQGLVPGSKPRAEHTFEPFPSLSWKEVRKQYFDCFPRAYCALP